MSILNQKVIRAKFVRKVYGLLLSQLAFTTAVIAVFIFMPGVKDFYCTWTAKDKMVIDNKCNKIRKRISKLFYSFLLSQMPSIVKCKGISENGYIMYLVSYVIFFMTYISLVCCESLRRKSPANLVTLFIFTTALSIMAGSIAIYHDVWWVLMAMGLTTALCLGLTLFSFQTKWDVTGN